MNPILDPDNVVKNYHMLQGIYGCLSKLKTPSSSARRKYGNERDFDPLPELVDPFLIDTCKIEQSKGWRRLMEKTQVLTAPQNAHIRMRAGHTDEVVAAATFIAANLGLNIDMVRAIAKGHDIGHTPFGHSGEAFINRKLRERSSSSAPYVEFKHEVMSSIVLQEIERGGIGINITHQVLTAIPQHSRGKRPLEALPDMTQEAAVVMCSDKIGYITGDFSDMERIRIPIPKELNDEMYSLGQSQRERTRALITALCLESAENGKVSFHRSEVAKKFAYIKELMYRVYPALNIYGCEPLEKAYGLISKFMDESGDTKKLFCIDPLLVMSLMTDKDVLHLSNTNVATIQHLQQTSVWELLASLNGKNINYTKLDLNW